MNISPKFDGSAVRITAKSLPSITLLTGLDHPIETIGDYFVLVYAKDRYNELLTESDFFSKYEFAEPEETDVLTPVNLI